MKVCPQGQVPSLTYNGKSLSQTTAMQRFICDTYPGGKSLYPDDVWTRAQIDFWLDFYNTDYRPCFAAHFKHPSISPFSDSKKEVFDEKD